MSQVHQASKGKKSKADADHAEDLAQAAQQAADQSAPNHPDYEQPKKQAGK
jgi:transposase